MKREASQRLFFRQLRDGRALRKNPLTWLAIGEAAGVLPDALLVRAVQDRLAKLVGRICAAAAFVSKVDRARRLQEIFRRHILGGEHWSSVTADLFVSRRQFFRERRFLCDELYALLQQGPHSPAGGVLVQPSREHLAYNKAFLAVQAGNLESAEQTLQELRAWLPPGDLRAKALVLAADCAMDRLHFEDAAARCAAASTATGAIEQLHDREIESARVHLAQSRYYLLSSDYRQAHVEIQSALQRLSRLSPVSDSRRCELMRSIFARQAELAIQVGDFALALEHVRRSKYAAGPNESVSEAIFDLASVESATETCAGRFQSASILLDEAFATAERLGFNRQVVKLSIERAWVDSSLDNGRGLQLSPQVAALAECLRVPALTVEAALFCAVNDAPTAAMEYASRARSVSPRHSMWAARATHALAVACVKRGRMADALDLATEVEALSDRLDNNRMRAASLALQARINLLGRNPRSATTLKLKAEELLRQYAAASERNTFAEWTQSS